MFRQSLLGFFISIFVAWCLSIIFLDSVVPKEWDSFLDRYVPKSEIKIKFRSEGWATTHMGRYGIAGIENASDLNGSKIIIWGNSQVEAWQVKDSEKMAQVFTDLCRKEGLRPIVGVGIGQSGDKIPDYYFKIPKIERLIQNIKYHVIVVNSLTEFSTLDNGNGHAEFHHKNNFYLTVPNYQPSLMDLKFSQLFYEFHLELFFHLFNKVRSAIKKIEFKIGPHKPTSSPDQAPSGKGPDLKAWDFLLGKLKDQTHLPILFVYCPYFLEINGSLISLESPDMKWMKAFLNLCKKYDFAMVDAREDFLNYHRRTGKFPRGFFNTPPSKGHFNAPGHKIIAEKIFHFLKKTDF